MMKDEMMNVDRYPITQLVADVKRVCARFEDEREILSHSSAGTACSPVEDGLA